MRSSFLALLDPSTCRIRFLMTSSDPEIEIYTGFIHFFKNAETQTVNAVIDD